MAQPGSSSRRAEKSAAAFRTISEVAGALDVQQHVLRFWETKFNQVRPLKRGGGRRYYRPEDVLLLKRIRGLLYDDGYTIKGAQRLLREGSLRPETIASVKRVHTTPPAGGPPPAQTAPTQTAAAPIGNSGAHAPAPAAQSAPTSQPTPAAQTTVSTTQTASDSPESGPDAALRGELREILAELKVLRAMLPDRSS